MAPKKDYKDMRWLNRDGESSMVEESYFLGMLVLATKPRVAVETGTHNGCTTVHIAEGLPKNGHLWTYDIKGCGARSTKKVSYKIISSLEAKFPKAIDFAFLDACHETDFVIKEFKRIKRNLNPGALVVFHDYVPWDKGYVAAAIRKLKLKGVYIPTHYGMFIYHHEK